MGTDRLVIVTLIVHLDAVSWPEYSVLDPTVHAEPSMCFLASENPFPVTTVVVEPLDWQQT